MQPNLRAEWKDALMDSSPLEPGRHEEGGWVYQCPADWSIKFARATPGTTAGIILSDPPVMTGCFIIATYHTHPNTGNNGPSVADTNADVADGVPGVVIEDGWCPGVNDGTHLYDTHNDTPQFTAGTTPSVLAPESRSGGLTGSFTFP